MVTSNGKRKTDDEISFTLKRIKKNEAGNEPEPIKASFQIADIEKLHKSVKQRPWILDDQRTNPDRKHINTNISLENTLPKGVIRGCSDCDNCQKVIARCRPEDSCRPSVEYAPEFNPTEHEFKDIFQYIAKIRPKAEEYGICLIIPPGSWKRAVLLEGNRFESSKFGTRVQQIDALKDLFSKRELKKTIDQTKSDHGSHGFEFQSGPEFTLPAYKQYADYFKRKYFHKKDIFSRSGAPLWRNVEGEYWRIVQNPTEEIQVLSGHNLDPNVLSIDDAVKADKTTYAKSGWNLRNTSKMPGSLLAFDCDNSTLSTPRLDVGMCFSSLCWKVEEHYLYILSYIHQGASRIWYGVPGKYHPKCEALVKKTFPELSGHRELFHKLVTQISPSTLKSEGIPVYRCVQYSKQFVVIFPGAYYSGFNTGFNVCEKVKFAPLDWLPHGELSVETYSEVHRKTSISYDRLLLEGARDAAKSPWEFRMRGWNNARGKDGWLTKALKSRLKLETFKRELLCNASSESRKMEGESVKRECIVCFYDLYLSAVGCPCSPDKYSCLQHSKQICMCPWSSRIFLFRFEISEMNLLIDALEGKVNPRLTTAIT